MGIPLQVLESRQFGLFVGPQTACLGNISMSNFSVQIKHQNAKKLTLSNTSLKTTNRIYSSRAFIYVVTPFQVARFSVFIGLPFRSERIILTE